MSDMSGASGPSPIRVDTGPTQAPIAGRPPVPAIDTGNVETADEMVKSAMEYESRQGDADSNEDEGLAKSNGRIRTARRHDPSPECSTAL